MQDPAPTGSQRALGSAAPRRRRRRRPAARLRPARDRDPAAGRARGRRRRRLRAGRPGRGRPDGRDRRRRRRSRIGRWPTTPSPGGSIGAPTRSSRSGPGRWSWRRTSPPGVPSDPATRSGRALALQLLGVALAKADGIAADRIVVGAYPGWLADEPSAVARILAEVDIRRALFPDQLDPLRRAAGRRPYARRRGLAVRRGRGHRPDRAASAILMRGRRSDMAAAAARCPGGRPHRDRDRRRVAAPARSTASPGITRRRCWPPRSRRSSGWPTSAGGGRRRPPRSAGRSREGAGVGDRRRRRRRADRVASTSSRRSTRR